MRLGMLCCRCLTFTPANRSNRFLKPGEEGADGVIIDLEDSVAVADKVTARQTVLEFFRQRDQNGLSGAYGVRINALNTAAGVSDLAALSESGLRPDFLMLPKVESAAVVRLINDVLAPRCVPLIATIESAAGLMKVNAIAAVDNVVALAFGGADYAAELGATMAWEPMYHARACLANAAAAAGIVAIDVPFLDLSDREHRGLREEALRVKALGFSGKLSIHPQQVKPIVEAFKPSADEVERAKKVISAFQANGGNACQLDGKMIDMPVYQAALRVMNSI